METLSVVIFGTFTVLLAGGMLAALLWAAARDGEMDRRANLTSIEPIPAPENTFSLAAQQWTPSFDE